ncbi:MAG: hypothetical protein H7Y02_10775 [Candidatus Obscuribacterales bacterium]|nr:hypothetical protein [Steroidobacteraceae bacterium]
MNAFRALLLAVTVSLIAACSSTPSKPAAPAAPPPAPAVTVAGNWVMTIESQMGAQDSKFVVNQNGKDISGTLETQMGTQNYTGTFDGKEIKFGFMMNAQGMDLKLDFMGTSDGQTMNGKAVFGTFGEGTFKAKRQ